MWYEHTSGEAKIDQLLPQAINIGSERSLELRLFCEKDIQGDPKGSLWMQSQCFCTVGEAELSSSQGRHHESSDLARQHRNQQESKEQ